MKAVKQILHRPCAILCKHAGSCGNEFRSCLCLTSSHCPLAEAAPAESVVAASAVSVPYPGLSTAHCGAICAARQYVAFVVSRHQCGGELAAGHNQLSELVYMH